jgi:hypothetical protein
MNPDTLAMIGAIVGKIALVQTLEDYVCDTTGHPAYDIRVGLRENGCLSAFKALYTANNDGHQNTAKIINDFIHAEYNTDHVLKAWDEALVTKVPDIPAVICKYLALRLGSVVINKKFSVWTAIVILSLVVTTHGTSLRSDLAQVFAVQLLEAISDKKGPFLTRCLLNTPVKQLILCFICFYEYQDKDLGGEVLDILLVNKRDAFHAYLTKPDRSTLANTNFADIVRVFGNEEAADYIADPDKASREATYAQTLQPMMDLMFPVAMATVYHHDHHDLSEARDGYSMDLDA